MKCGLFFIPCSCAFPSARCVHVWRRTLVALHTRWSHTCDSDCSPIQNSLSKCTNHSPRILRHNQSTVAHSLPHVWDRHKDLPIVQHTHAAYQRDRCNCTLSNLDLHSLNISRVEQVHMCNRIDAIHLQHKKHTLCLKPRGLDGIPSISWESWAFWVVC
jgi:hypothetical protein